MNKTLIIFLLAFLLVSPIFMGFAQADLGGTDGFPQNTCVNIRTLSNFTAVNISTITIRNTTTFLNAPMSNLVGQTFNYTYCNTSVTGVYVYAWHPCPNLECVNSFTITPSGRRASTSDSILYMVLLVLSVVFNIFLIYMITVIDPKNVKDKDGEFIGINLKKYGRIVLVGVTYFFILLTLNLMVAVASALIFLSQFTGLIGTIFTIMLKLVIPWVIFIFIWMITMLIKDYNLVQDIKARLEEVGRL